MNLCSESFQAFLRTIARDRFDRVSSDAIGCVAEELHIGRITFSINVPKSDELIEGQNESILLYESPNGFSSEISLSHRMETGDGGEAVLNCFSTPDDREWTDSEREDLDVLINILILSGARYRLTYLIQRAALTQYKTGLPNSGGYLKKIGRLFSKGQFARYDAYYLNIKGMALMNLKFGQREGDEIIKRYSQYLYSHLLPDEAMGHLGGDNFTAMIRKEHVKEWEQLLNGVESFAMRDGEAIPITIQATAGVMRLDGTEEGPWMVMNGPSIAMHYAKSTMSSLVVLTRELVAYSNHVKQVESAFYRAIRNDEYQPYFQPKVNMRTGEIVGAEVLTRWIKGKEVMPPGEFIPVLEQTGEIAELDLYILEKSCRMLRAWKEEGVRMVPLSVNLSRKDLSFPDLSQRVIELFDRYVIDRRDIVIEITETDSAKENTIMMGFLHDLSEAGINTSIDDFGTGYSSLSFLRDFPVGEIKIDRSFINHQILRDKDRIIISSIIDMAERLGVEVITEGVENKDQVDFLLDLGCDKAQGFLYDRPLPAEDFLKRLQKGPYQI